MKNPRWAALACAVVLFGCGTPSKPLVDLTDGPPNIVIFLLDTVRADHLGVYGAPEGRTPGLDAFAAEAIVFDDASSSSTWTLPATASLYTGLMPQRHGTIGGDHSRLPEHVPTLAEILQVRGYKTTAMVAVDFLGADFGMNRGFWRFAKNVDGAVSSRLRRYEGRVKGLLSVPPMGPSMTLIHYFDAHDPYLPPKPYDGKYYDGDPSVVPDDPARDISVIYSERNRSGTKNLRRRYDWLERIKDLDYPVQQYAAGVSFLDEHLGKIFELMRTSGSLDKSIVIVLADHGEHLTEHDIYFTHRLPYAECLQIPLMIRLPHGVGGGRRVSDPVSLIDVLPTLMELCGLELESEVDGVSLVPSMRGERLEERLLFAEFGAADDNWAKSVWNERWRYTEIHVGDDTTYELFDRRGDPLEIVNLIEQQPEHSRSLRSALDAQFGVERRRLLDQDAKVTPAIDPAVQERLRALGYID